MDGFFRDLVGDAECGPGSNPLMKAMNQFLMPGASSSSDVHRQDQEYAPPRRMARGGPPAFPQSREMTGQPMGKQRGGAPFGVFGPDNTDLLGDDQLFQDVPLDELHDALARIEDPQFDINSDGFIDYCRDIAMKASEVMGLAEMHEIERMSVPDLFGFLRMATHQAEMNQQGFMDSAPLEQHAEEEDWLDEFENFDQQQYDNKNQQQFEEFEQIYNQRARWNDEYTQFLREQQDHQINFDHPEFKEFEDIYNIGKRASGWMREFEAETKQLRAQSSKDSDQWAEQFMKQEEEFTTSGAKGKGKGPKVFGVKGKPKKSLEEKMSESKFFKYMEQMKSQEQQEQQQQDAVESDQWTDEFFNNWTDTSVKPAENVDFDDMNLDINAQYMKFLEQFEHPRSKDQYKFEKNNPYLDHPSPLEEGEQLHQNGCLVEAILAYEAACQKDPQNARAWGLLGLGLSENDNDLAAIPALQRSVDIMDAAGKADDPFNLEVMMALAVGYTNERFTRITYYTRALETLEKWIRTHPKYKHIEAPSGMENNNGQMINRRHQQITNMYILAAQEANQDDDIDADLQIGLGILCNLSDEYDNAAECFRTALIKRPQDYRLWNKLGATLANNNKFHEAIDAYNHALDLNVNYVRGRINMGISHLSLLNFREAATWFLSALHLQQSSAVGANSNSRNNNNDNDNDDLFGGGGSGVDGNNGPSYVDDAATWDKLRMTFQGMEREDLVEKTRHRDLSLFEDEFDFY